MKKLFCFLAIIISSALVSVRADELNSSQLKLRNEIKTFLQEEGYMPEIDSDGDIAFKKEGDKYYVIVNSSDSSPMYVTLSKFFSYGEKDNRHAIASGLERANLIKGVKVILFEKRYILQAEMYLVNSESFKYVFYKLMKQLDALEKRVNEICTSDGGSSSSSHGSGYSNNGSASTILINDTFSSYTSVWTASDGKLSFSNGKMLFKDVDDYGWSKLCRSLPRNLKSEDFELTFSLKINFKQDYSSIGFLMGLSSDWNKAYRFGISKREESTSFSFGTYSESTKYQSYKVLPELRPLITHRYKMIKRGQTMTWYIDETILCTVTVDSIDINDVAFFISDHHNIEVDDFTIRLL